MDTERRWPRQLERSTPDGASGFRVGLEHKVLPYEFRTITPRDRDDIVRRSGQFLTPVMEHGETLLFDSAAILRNLDANFPDTPKPFGGSHHEQWEIEDWERFGRGPLEDEGQARATREFATALGTLESRLD